MTVPPPPAAPRPLPEAEELRLAFAPPEARVAATAPAGLADRIALRNHLAEVEIGAFQSERGVRQRLRFDVVVEIAPPGGPVDDDVDRILSYDRIAEAIAASLAEGRVNLLETLAEAVAARLLAAPQAARVFLRIEKLDRGPGDLGVEIVRQRGAVPAPGPAAAPVPLVVFLTEAGILSLALAGHLDALAAEGRPLLLAVGLPPGAVPVAAGEAGRRIGLLAIEQNAWRLTDRLPGLEVAATLTEIDWALRRGRRIVWAPGRLVLDAVPPPAGGPVALAHWLAGRLGAARLVVLGEGGEAPAGGPPVDFRPL